MQQVKYQGSRCKDYNNSLDTKDDLGQMTPRYCICHGSRNIWRRWRCNYMRRWWCECARWRCKYKRRWWCECARRRCKYMRRWFMRCWRWCQVTTYCIDSNTDIDGLQARRHVSKYKCGDGYEAHIGSNARENSRTNRCRLFLKRRRCITSHWGSCAASQTKHCRVNPRR